jgi:hypothetical protein
VLKNAQRQRHNGTRRFRDPAVAAHAIRNAHAAALPVDARYRALQPQTACATRQFASQRRHQRAVTIERPRLRAVRRIRVHPFCAHFLRADARRIRRVEPFDHEAGRCPQVSRQRGTWCAREQRCERYVTPGLRQFAHRHAYTAKRVAALKGAVLLEPVFAARIERDQTGAAQPFESDVRRAVDKLGAQFYWQRHAGLSARPATSADAVARFEQQHRLRRLRQQTGSGKPRCAGADDHHVEGFSAARDDRHPCSVSARVRLCHFPDDEIVLDGLDAGHVQRDLRSLGAVFFVVRRSIQRHRSAGRVYFNHDLTQPGLRNQCSRYHFLERVTRGRHGGAVCRRHAGCGRCGRAALKSRLVAGGQAERKRAGRCNG